jgi:uncharacterized membrane protein
MIRLQEFVMKYARPLRWILIGAVGLLLLVWLLATPPGLWGKTDAIGYAVCHRIDLRSFHVHGRQLSLCARCSGQYLGAMIGLAYLAWRAPRRGGMPPLKVMLLLGSFVLAYALDGLNSYLHIPFLMEAFPGLPRLYEPNNTLRLLTGTGMGLVIISAVYPAFNSTVWKHYDPRAVLPGLGSLVGMILLALLASGLVLTEYPWILYPLALVSAAGVWVLLTMIYTVAILLLVGGDNRIDHGRQLIFPLIGGFMLCLIQIVLLDWLRYLLTGTWQGFVF